MLAQNPGTAWCRTPEALVSPATPLYPIPTSLLGMVHRSSILGSDWDSEPHVEESR